MISHPFIRITACLIFVALAVGPTSVGAQGPAGFTAEQEAELQGLLDQAIEGDVVGIVMWVDSPGGQFVGASGLASEANNIPMEADAAFRIASNTKTFVAVTMLLLQEEGVLSLDDPLSLYLPDIAARIRRGDQITLRHLLNHTSGIPDYTASISDREFLWLENNTRQWEPEEIIDFAIDREFNSLFAPGTSFEYSDTNYILAGMVIEAVTGTPAAEQIRQRIIDPLNLESTYLADAEPATVDLIDNHTQFSGTRGAFDYNASSEWTAGAMVSNAPDMITFARAVYSGQIFADPDSRDQLLDFVPTDVATYYPGYGLGVIQISEEPLTYGHAGNMPGYLSIVRYAPDVDTVVVVLTNSDYVNPDFEALTVRALQISGLTELELPAPPEEIEPAVTLEDPINPIFQVDDQVTLPATPFQQLLYDVPGGQLASAACFAGYTVTILQVGSVDGVDYYQVDCMGMIGWVTADQLQ